MFAALVLAVLGAGCDQQSAPDQSEIKQAFIRQLIGFCAEVDRQLDQIDQKTHPGIYANWFARFVSQARSQPAPDVDRAQFDILVTEMDGSARHFRAAQTALAAGDQSAYQEALTQAQRQFGSADAAAQKYGMPPLSTCPQHESTTPPAPSPSTPAPAGAWQPRHASLTAVQQVSAAVMDGQIWVAGGLTTSTKGTAATQIYDPTKDAWRPGPSLPEGVDHAMLVTYRNRVVLIGGFRSRGGVSVASPQVLIFDDSIGHWVPGPSLHHPRAAAAAAVVGDKIVVVGGRTGSKQLVGQTEVYDGAAWRDGASIPVPGDHLAAASDRSYLYAVGGRKFDSRNNTSAVQRYEPATDRWTQLAALPKPLSGAGAAIINGQLLVAGGENATPTVVSTVQAYDLIAPTATWITLPSLTLARHGLAVTAIGNTLYAIDGSTHSGHTASTPTVDALNFS
ncbi:kelch repeat-containing protein [Kribbella sp. NPDC050281]|uniref:Kelch repeat-containing protein n=1 Tax=Kribbella sp. NPDC050281 TaxID=3155515 RepID=UPI00340A9F56